MSASAKNYLLWMVAQFDPFSRDMVLSSEVVAGSQSPRRTGGFNFSAGVHLSEFSFCHCFVLRESLREAIK